MGCLKLLVNKIDIHRLKVFPADLNKISSIEDKSVVRKTEYNELITKVNAADPLKLIYGNMKKVLKPLEHQTIVLIQNWLIPPGK